MSILFSGVRGGGAGESTAPPAWKIQGKLKLLKNSER